MILMVGATLQELRERQSIVHSTQSLDLAPLAIVLYQESSLRQMAVERKRGVGQSMDFTRSGWASAEGQLSTSLTPL